MRFRLQFALLVLGTTLAGGASAKEQITDETLEAKTGMLTLPSVSDGVLLVKVCQQCAVHSLQASTATRYLINGKANSLKDFADYVRVHGNAFAAVNYDTKTRALHRISVTAR